MARLPRTAAGWLVAVSLVSLMVPITALLVPRFAIFSWLGLTNTYVPLIAPALIGMSPFYVLLFYWGFRRIPAEIFEACRLEGLSPLTVWRRIAMPLVRPVTVAVAVLAAVFTWSNFLDPLIYLFDADKFTLPLGLRSLAQLDRQDFPLLLAGAVVATLPVIAAFLYVQRFFLQEQGARVARAVSARATACSMSTSVSLTRAALGDLVHPPLAAVAVAGEGRLGLVPLRVADADLVAVLGERVVEEGRRPPGGRREPRRGPRPDSQRALRGGDHGARR